MTRVIAKSNAKSDPVPTVILYGQSEIGKARAGVFKAANVDAALKAAHLLHLSVLKADGVQAHDLAAKLPAGRIQGKGQAILPFVSSKLFKELIDLATNAAPAGSQSDPQRTASQSANAGPKATSSASGPRLPANWDDITVGDLVVSQDADPDEGWWQAIVVEKNSDIFKLRWQKSKRGRPFQKHRLALSLMYPGNVVLPATEKNDSTKSAEVSAFPRNWHEIGINQIVLAKEEGPMEQWWEARTVAQDKDTFTLEWREFPHLPPIVRSRLALALLHPHPKAR